MNLRSYFRILHPATSVIGIAAYSACGSNLVIGLGGLTALQARSYVVLTLLPLLVGMVIAGVAHEVMHRPFSPLLPGVGREMRKFTAAAILVASLLIAALSANIAPELPISGGWGLVVLLLALPCMNPRRRLGGFVWSSGTVLVWVCAIPLLGHSLPQVLAAAPWAFAGGGPVLTVWILARTFTRSAVRNRSAIWYHSQASAASLLFDRTTQARYLAEHTAMKARGAQSSASARFTWQRTSVGPAISDWMRVIWCGFSGAQGTTSFWRIQFRFALLTAGLAAAIPVFFTLLGKISKQPFGLHDYWWFLGRLGALEFDGSKLVAYFASMAWLVHPGLAKLLMVSVPQPQLAYPISRTRLADAIFGLTLLNYVAALIVPGVVLLAIALLGQSLSGVTYPGHGAVAFAAMEWLLLVSLPLLACSGTFRHPVLRMAGAIVIGITCAAATLLRAHWAPYVLALPGVIGGVMATAASLFLLRWLLRRRFRKNDLQFGTAVTTAFGSAVPC